MRRVLKRRPRKGLMRMGPHEFDKKMRDYRRQNFEMKRWVRDYYERYEFEE